MSGGVGSVGTGIGVCVAVGVGVGVSVDGAVNVAVGVAVAVLVPVGVNPNPTVGVGVSVAGDPLVLVGFGFKVDVAVAGGNIHARVGLAVGALVFVMVADEMIVVTTVETGEAGVRVGKRVPVTNDASGVRKRLSPAGCVRMDASTRSMNPLGLRVRKSLFGSRFESMFVFNFQLGEKRSAHCPAMITHRNPMIRMMGIMNLSRRSCSGTFMGQSIDWQSHKNCCARIRCFIVAGTLQPNASVMRVHNPA
jgi:hypothetical protein